MEYLAERDFVKESDKKPWHQYAKEILKHDYYVLKKEELDAPGSDVQTSDYPRPSKVLGLIGYEEEEIAQEWAENKFGHYPQHKHTVATAKYKEIICIYLFIQAIVAITATIAYFFLKSQGLWGSIPLILVCWQALHVAMSLRIVAVEDLAGISIFSKPLYVPQSGLYLIPFGIMSLSKANRNYKDVHFPGPADKIYRVSNKEQMEQKGGDAIPPEYLKLGYVRPIYTTTGQPKFTKDELKERRRKLRSKDIADVSLDPLDMQIVIDPQFFVQYRVNAAFGGIFRIIRNLSSKSGHIDGAIKDLLREQSYLIINEMIAEQTNATLIANRRLFNQVFIARLQLAVLRLGIDVRTGGITEMNASHKTHEEIAEISRELARRESKVIQADTERRAKELKGRGDGRYEEEILAGKGRGVKQYMADAEISGEEILASEAVIKALPDTTFVAGTEGVEKLFGLVSGGKHGLMKNRKQEVTHSTRKEVTDEQ